MNGWSSFCLISCNWASFLSNRIIILLSDKLLPDFYHGFFWSAENVVLNYLPTQDGVWVLLCPLIFIRHMTIFNNFMADVQPILVKMLILHWQMLLPRLLWQILLSSLWHMSIPLCVWDVNTTHICCYCFVDKQGGRCSCHYFVWYMVKPHN